MFGVGLPFLIFVYGPHVEEHLPRLLKEAGPLTAVLAPALPWAIWKKVHPRPIDVRSLPSWIDFLFRSEVYALAFEEAKDEHYLPLG